MDCMYTLTTAYWVICILGCILVVFTPFFSKRHAYGKLRVGKQYLSGLLPKHLFSHFYYVGFTWTALLLYTCNTHDNDKTLFNIIRSLLNILFHGCEDAACNGQEMPNANAQVGPASPFNVNVGLVGILIHTAVRLWECVFLFDKGSAKMHIFGYLIGVSFYLGAPWTVVVASRQWRCEREEAVAEAEGEVDVDVDVLCVVKGVVVGLLYVWSSVHQHRCHRILAGLRHDEDGDGYKIPRGDYFELVSCPHYFMEIVMYFSLLVWNSFELNSILLFTFVLLNLSITGCKTHAWYINKFPEEYPRERKAIIPYLL